MEICHYLLTRFNIDSGSESWNYDKTCTSTRTDVWMQDRINIFLKFTHPSVTNQSNQNFKWLIFFDSNTEKKWFQIMKPYLSFSMIEIILINQKESLDENLKNYLKGDLIGKENFYLITTRIDNDDAFHENAIEIIQQQCQMSKNRLLINILNGYYLKTNFPFVLCKAKHNTNAFISLALKNCTKIETVFSRNHMHYASDPDLFQILNKPLWIINVHERNLLNRLRGFPLLSFNELENFNIEFQYRIKWNYFLIRWFTSLYDLVSLSVVKILKNR